jgi:YidC/Oxa1 family membrane protein insertase
MNIWTTILYQPLLNLLIFFYQQFSHNLGLAILGVTVLTSLFLLPLTLPSLQLSKKQKELRGEIEELRKKFGDDKKKFAEEQMKLYQQHGVHPAQGCLPQILRIVILIALYQAFRQVLVSNGGGIQDLNNLLYSPALHIDPSAGVNTTFLYLDLAKKDPYYLMPVLAGITQFALSKVMTFGQTSAPETREEKEHQPEDIAQDMQKQMMYIMPIMTVFIMAGLPSGLTLYWFLSTVMSLVVQLAYLRKLPWQII